MGTNNIKRVGKYFALLVTAGLLGACSIYSSPAMAQPPMEQVMIATTKSPTVSTYTPTIKPMPSVTASLTPTSMSSPTQAPNYQGMLFFDMNGSGLPDEATFTYNSARLADPRQPLQPDLKRSIDDYVQAHPDMKDGDLITIEEPGLSGYPVCVQADCVQTDPHGNFSLPNKSGDSKTSIIVTDPYAGTPTLEIRYINQWNKAVVIPTYEVKGMQVPEQHLNDTTVLPLEVGIFIKAGANNKVGLMQGFLTSPVIIEQSFVLTYQDNNTNPGVVLDWKGDTISVCRHAPIPHGVVCDQHRGTDFVPNNQDEVIFVYASAPGEINFSDTLSNGAIVVTLDHFIGSQRYQTTYGHLEVFPDTFSLGLPIYRGQIVGIMGKSGGTWIKHVHSEFVDMKLPANSDGSPKNIDSFASLNDNSFLNYWSIYNTPITPLLK